MRKKERKVKNVNFIVFISDNNYEMVIPDSQKL